MKESLYEQLIKDNPELFENGECEFSVGNGWYNILSALLSIVTSDLTQAKYRLKFEKENYDRYATPELAEKAITECEAAVEAALAALPRIVQVKEKFGSLRFYYNGGNPTLAGAVYMAEAMSARTCHVCGSPGEKRNEDWVQVLCDAHYKEQRDHLQARKAGRRLPAINYDAE